MKRRVHTIEQYARANLVSLRDLLPFYEASLVFFRSLEATTPGAHDVALMFQWFVTPLRAGDGAEFMRRNAEWGKLDDEQRIRMLQETQR